MSDHLIGFLYQSVWDAEKVGGKVEIRTKKGNRRQRQKEGQSKGRCERSDPEKWISLLWIDSSSSDASLHNLSHTHFSRHGQKKNSLVSIIFKRNIHFLKSIVLLKSLSLSVNIWHQAVMLLHVYSPQPFIDIFVMKTYWLSRDRNRLYNFIHIFITSERWQEIVFLPKEEHLHYVCFSTQKKGER